MSRKKVELVITFFRGVFTGTVKIRIFEEDEDKNGISVNYYELSPLKFGSRANLKTILTLAFYLTKPCGPEDEITITFIERYRFRQKERFVDNIVEEVKEIVCKGDKKEIFSYLSLPAHLLVSSK